MRYLIAMTGTPTSDKKRYHHGDLRNALLDAGLEILAREGIGAVTLRAIAARAGVSHAAPAHHFGNLRGLMTALAAIAFDRLYASVDTAKAGAAKEPIEQARAAGTGYVDFARHNPGLFRLMFSSSLIDYADPGLQLAAKRAYEQLLDTAAPAVAQRGGGASEDVSAVALQLWCTVHGFAHLLLEDRIAASEDGQPPASRLPDIAGLLFRETPAPSQDTAKPKRRGSAQS
jgi:AcrR family transcriptional regulator